MPWDWKSKREDIVFLYNCLREAQQSCEMRTLQTLTHYDLNNLTDDEKRDFLEHLDIVTNLINNIYDTVDQTKEIVKDSLLKKIIKPI